MSIASVLVHVGNDARTTERLEAATALARIESVDGLHYLPMQAAARQRLNFGVCS